jgi:hypothetical protein
MPFQVPMEPGRMEKNHAFIAPFKEKWKMFNLTCSSSTPCRIPEISMRVYSSKSIKYWQ